MAHLGGEHLAVLVGGRLAVAVRAAPREQRLEERVVRLGERVRSSREVLRCR